MSYKEAQEILSDINACLVLEKTLLIRSANTDCILNKIKEEVYNFEW
jgi:hypothetical protein